MEKKAMRVIVIVLVVLAMFLMLRNCKLTPRLNKQQGEIALRDEQIKEGGKHLGDANKALRDAEKAHSKKIGVLNGHIDSANTVIVRLEGEDRAKARRIAELEAETPDLPVECQPLIQAWKDRFNLCEQTIGEKDTIIFSLSGQYEAEYQLRLQVEGALSQAQGQIVLLTEQVGSTSKLNQTLKRRLRLSKALKTGASLAFVCAVAYVVLRK